MLESFLVRPRQARYQAALRPDVIARSIIEQFSPQPIERVFLQLNHALRIERSRRKTGNRLAS